MSEPTAPGARASGPPEPDAERRPAPQHTAGGSPVRLFYLGLLAVLVVVGVGVWYAVGRRDTRDDLARLQGEWAVSVNGREGVVSVRIDGDRWTYVAQGVERQSYRITLRPEASPREIDLAQLDASEKEAKNTVGRADLLVGLHGVYAFEGDAVKVVLMPGVEARPKSVTDPGDAQALTLTRAKR